MQHERRTLLRRDSDSRLRDLEAPPELLRQAIEAGERARLRCNAFHPKNAGGMLAWIERVGALRLGLAGMTGSNWRPEDPGLLPRMVNVATGIGITTSMGDQHTGHPDAAPKTKYPLREMTQGLLRENERQMDLYTPNAWRWEIKGQPVNYILLVFPVFNSNEVRAELSLPASIDGNYEITDYVERVILDPMIVDGIYIEPPDEPPPMGPDVPVRRR